MICCKGDGTVPICHEFMGNEMTPCALRPFRGFISGPGDTFGTRSQRGRAFFDFVRFSRAIRAVLQADPVRKRLSMTILRDVLVRTGFF